LWTFSGKKGNIATENSRFIPILALKFGYLPPPIFAFPI
jgi:hypothetical protein